MTASDEMNSSEEERPFKSESEVEACFKTQSTNEEEKHDTLRPFLTKDELDKFANDPYWWKVRLILVVAFLVGLIAMFVAAIVITVSAPRCPRRPVQKWFDKETVYEILPESFQDTSSKAANGAAKKGDGVGDIKGKIYIIFDYRINYYLYIYLLYIVIC